MLKLKGYKPKKISEVAEILKNESDVVRALLSEAVKLVKLVQSQPTSAASAERAFSCLRRVKTYLQSTLTQARLTHLTVINMNKIYLDSLFTETYERFCCKDARTSFNFQKILISPSHLFLSGRPIFVFVSVWCTVTIKLVVSEVWCNC